MIDISRVHEVEQGLQIVDGPLYTGGADAPSIALASPNVPTVYTQGNGVIWRHNGTTGPWTVVGGNNFSFHRIDEEITVYTNQQMTIHGEFEVTPQGCFSVELGGSFVLKEG
jgi:hypothetical protein